MSIGKLAAELIETRIRLEWLDTWWAAERERRIKDGTSGRVEIHVHFDGGRVTKIIVSPTLVVGKETRDKIGQTELAASLAEIAGRDWRELSDDEKGLLTSIAGNLG